MATIWVLTQPKDESKQRAIRADVIMGVSGDMALSRGRKPERISGCGKRQAGLFLAEDRQVLPVVAAAESRRTASEFSSDAKGNPIDTS
ncbi:hypothetical protein [Streptomyces achromogenes]|uniref:hypothetical protein n=1 Tax=Streptomyces achromogenes TaxID=67255 RepID=UPI0012FE9916|nr:hypothetical protein [Streptomyces achromogenes]